jgi:hypothetical protein
MRHSPAARSEAVRDWLLCFFLAHSSSSGNPLLRFGATREVLEGKGAAGGMMSGLYRVYNSTPHTVTCFGDGAR